MRESDQPLWALWGSELSPFALKVEAMLRFAGIAYRWLPACGGFTTAARFDWRRRSVVARRLPLTWPQVTDLDEFPLVPFLFGPAGENLYDSSAIAVWLDRHSRFASAQRAVLLPSEDPALHFAVRLIDEAFDEVGLYLVHHNRWVVAAHDNDAAARLAKEFRPLAGPFAFLIEPLFAARQVRRLPYLFSVAPAGDDARFADLPRRLRPPSRPGFPPTHRLLDEAFAELLARLEPIFAAQPYLFGACFTLADASIYGQLGMNRKDPSARALIAGAAPATQAWIERIAMGDLGPTARTGKAALHGALRPLFAWICTLFVPLMQQNYAAWLRHRQAGERLFNEAAFDMDRAMYDGILRGQPFRSVVKTFQVRVWRELRAEWKGLDAAARGRLEAYLPEAHGLDRDETSEILG